MNKKSILCRVVCLAVIILFSCQSTENARQDVNSQNPMEYGRSYIVRSKQSTAQGTTMDIGVPVDPAIFYSASGGFLEFHKVAVSKEGSFTAMQENIAFCISGFELEAGAVLFDGKIGRASCRERV